MSHTLNDLGQPVGLPILDALPRPFPERRRLTGRFGALEALREDHADALFEAFSENADHANWTYLPEEPWASVEQARASCRAKAASRDPLFWVILDAEGRAVGHLSLLRITPEVGSVEVGFVHYGPALQRHPLATEIQYLMMREVFDGLGYRRYEWKCDALNAPSCRAAERLGFVYEGTFRQATVYKGRNRDTAWYATLDRDWPRLRDGFERWLAPDNFDATGQQKQRLEALRAAPEG